MEENMKIKCSLESFIKHSFVLMPKSYMFNRSMHFKGRLKSEHRPLLASKDNFKQPTLCSDTQRLCPINLVWLVKVISKVICW